MKIFTLRARTLLPLAAVGGALLLGLAAVFLVPPVQSAFSSTSGRQLPIYSVQTDEKKAALGINCAWDDADILPMISTLQEYDVKATFFLLGEWAAKYPAAARTIALAGQEIGSHANTHRDLDTLSEEEILQEIASSCQNIEESCGTRPVLLRPPSGSYNDAVIQCIHRSGCIPSGIWTHWTGRDFPPKKSPRGCPASCSPAASCCCTPAQNIPPKRCR